MACLGNAAITPDALGPRTARWVLATRHVAGREQLFRKFRPVAVLAPGVLGQTGIETAGIIRTVAREIGASAVLAIDALAAELGDLMSGLESDLNTDLIGGGEEA